ncbi:MAG: hypothetical protein CMK92_06470 [Pseudomonas sp.]|nr:hypothetical protein [Pseudomonas sp.]
MVYKQIIAMPCGESHFSETQPLSTSSVQQFKSLLEKLEQGVEITIDEIPWIGRLMSNDRDFACTGILISEKIVLTAAHCEENLKEPSFKWKQVGHFFTEERKAELYFKPKNSSLWGDDWSLYKLDQKIQTTSFPKIIPSNSIELKKGTLVSIGYPNNNNSIFKITKCNYLGEGINSKSFVTDCYSKEGMSGGPIFYVDDNGELFLIGIRSGPQSGLFIKNGTREIRSERFLPHIESN